MFIKLTQPATYSGDENKLVYINMALVREIIIGTHRPYARAGEGTVSIQPPIPCTVVCYTDEDVTNVLETPDQIMGLLNGPQIQGAPL